MKLMKMEWDEAEQCFLSVLKQLGWNDSEQDDQEKMNNEDGYGWIRIEALTGLGEVEARRCQRFCFDDFIWFRCMFRSLTFYKEALQYLPKKQMMSRSRSGKRNSVQLSRPYDGPQPHETAFYNQTESRILYQVKTIENLTNSALAEKILSNCLTSSKGKPITFDDDWLKQLMTFCSKEEQKNFSEHVKQSRANLGERRRQGKFSTCLQEKN